MGQIAGLAGPRRRSRSLSLPLKGWKNATLFATNCPGPTALFLATPPLTPPQLRAPPLSGISRSRSSPFAPPAAPSLCRPGPASPPAPPLTQALTARLGTVSPEVRKLHRRAGPDGRRKDAEHLQSSRSGSGPRPRTLGDSLPRPFLSPAQPVLPELLRLPARGSHSSPSARGRARWRHRAGQARRAQSPGAGGQPLQGPAPPIPDGLARLGPNWWLCGS